MSNDDDTIAQAKRYRLKCEMCCGGYEDPVITPGWVVDSLIALAESQAAQLVDIRALHAACEAANCKSRPHCSYCGDGYPCNTVAILDRKKS